MLRIDVIQHVGFEGPGSIAQYWADAGASLRIFDLSIENALPSLNGSDILIVMGGPMDFDDDEKCAWMPAEKALIREALQKKHPILGICLGAQLIAHCIDNSAHKGKSANIGWKSLTLTPEGKVLIGSADNHQYEQTVYFWHTDYFDCPQGAVNLAYSDAYPCLAFSYQDSAIGFQFHPEATKKTILDLIVHCGRHLHADAAEAMLQQAETHQDAQRMIDHALALLAKQAGKKA